MSLQNQMRRAIKLELKAQRQTRRSVWINIETVELLNQTPGRLIYRLECSEELRLSADSIIYIKAPGYDQVIRVQVLMASSQILIVLSEEPLPQTLGLVRCQFDPAFILKSLDEHLDQVLRVKPPPLKALTERRPPLPDTSNDSAIRDRLAAAGYTLNESQLRAVLRMQSDTLHLVWGPPGTGKTHTLGVSIAEHIHAGKTCLLLSNANTAVDELVKAVIRVLDNAAYGLIFRAGASADKEVIPYTEAAYYEGFHPDQAAKAKAAQRDLDRLATASQRQGNHEVHGDDIYRQIQEKKELIKSFQQEAKRTGNNMVETTQCVASTLANLVINQRLSEREFDVVYIDEASMVSLPFAFAGAAQASEQVILAGDFQQLPPICHSDNVEATDWFGRNVFDYLGVKTQVHAGELPSYVSMLQEQYRMTERIGSIVSNLSYGGKLATGEGKGLGARPLFIDVSALCPTSYFSVQSDSYYQPTSAILLSHLHRHFHEWLGPAVEFLSPFRAQKTLLQAIAKDLSSDGRAFKAATIHKSQGSQENTIIVDLTAHSADKPQRFFRGEETENLINVALSRAQEHLIVIGNLDMVRQLSESIPYWRRFLEMVEGRCDHIEAKKLIKRPYLAEDPAEAFASLGSQDDLQLPCVFVGGGDVTCSASVERIFSTSRAMMRLVVAQSQDVQSLGGGITYRNNPRGGLPVFALSRGVLCLPVKMRNGRQWLAERLPETTRSLSTLACGHLFDPQFDVKDSLRLLCTRCNRPLVLKRHYGDYRLACERGWDCGYSRPLGLKDAQILIEICNISCPECGAKPQPRPSSSNHAVFVGCSNYPKCQGKVSLSSYTDFALSF
jgi:hypothetical protein